MAMVCVEQEFINRESTADVLEDTYTSCTQTDASSSIGSNLADKTASSDTIDQTTQSQEPDESSTSKKSSLAFIIDFGNESSQNLNISDNLSAFLPKHVQQRVESRAKTISARLGSHKQSDKEAENHLPQKGGFRLRCQLRQARPIERHGQDSCHMQIGSDYKCVPAERRKSLPPGQLPLIPPAFHLNTTNALTKNKNETKTESKAIGAAQTHAQDPVTSPLRSSKSYTILDPSENEMAAQDIGRLDTFVLENEQTVHQAIKRTLGVRDRSSFDATKWKQNAQIQRITERSQVRLETAVLPETKLTESTGHQRIFAGNNRLYKSKTEDTTNNNKVPTNKRFICLPDNGTQHTQLSQSRLLCNVRKRLEVLEAQGSKDKQQNNSQSCLGTSQSKPPCSKLDLNSPENSSVSNTSSHRIFNCHSVEASKLTRTRINRTFALRCAKLETDAAAMKKAMLLNCPKKCGSLYSQHTGNKSSISSLNVACRGGKTTDMGALGNTAVRMRRCGQKTSCPEHLGTGNQAVGFARKELHPNIRLPSLQKSNSLVAHKMSAHIKSNDGGNCSTKVVLNLQPRPNRVRSPDISLSRENGGSKLKSAALSSGGCATTETTTMANRANEEIDIGRLPSPSFKANVNFIFNRGSLPSSWDENDKEANFLTELTRLSAQIHQKSEDITKQLGIMSHRHTGVAIPHLRTVTDTLVTTLTNLCRIDKDIKEIRTSLKITE